jgi:predicted PurR-regulated permease PerM
VSFVPYLGFIVGFSAASVAALFQFQDTWMLLGVLAVFGVGQAIEGMLLTPNLVGDRIGLHPVAVIFAVLAGGQLFGFFGVLVALPAAAVIVVWLRHLHRGLVEEKRPPRRARRRT